MSKSGWYKIKRGFFKKNNLYITLDIRELYELTDGCHKPMLSEVILGFCTMATQIIKRVYNKINYNEDKLMEKRSRASLAVRGKI